MTTSPDLKQRLDTLKETGVIAGWQERGATTNVGLTRAPLPWVIFPVSFGRATTYYTEDDLATAVSVLETFGSVHLTGKR